MPGAASILVVDDEPKIVKLTRDYLENDGYRVISTGDGSQVLGLVRRDSPDLVILDLMLPGMDGMEVCRRIRALPRYTPIIIVSAKSAETERILGLEQGADDYITKPFSPRELIARINAVLRRLIPEASDEVVEIDGLRLEPVNHRVTAGNREIELGPTEYRLLHFMMTHTERVYSRSQLLDRVWGDHVFVEERTVDVHIRRLRKALQPAGKDEWIQTVRGTGYRFSALAVPPVKDSGAEI